MARPTPRLTPGELLEAQARFEDGETQASLARRFGVSTRTIVYHRDRKGWVRGGTPEPDIDTLGDPADFIPEDPDIVEEDVRDAEITRLRAQLDQAEARIHEAETSARGIIERPVYHDADEVINLLGATTLRETAMQQLARESMKRRREGMPGWDISTESAAVEQRLREIAEQLVQERTKWVREQHQVRVVKMVTPEGNIVQVPVEEQINNEAGQQGTAIHKAKDKGYKLHWPYLCQTNDCWLESAVDGQGNLSLDGYCSPAHRRGDPYLGNPKAVEGVTTSDAWRTTVSRSV